MSKEETVEVTLRLPKAIVDFLGKENLEQRLTKDVIEGVLSQIEGDYFSPETVMVNHGLKRIFKQYNVLPCYYKDP